MTAWERALGAAERQKPLKPETKLTKIASPLDKKALVVRADAGKLMLQQGLSKEPDICLPQGPEEPLETAKPR